MGAIKKRPMRWVFFITRYVPLDLLSLVLLVEDVGAVYVR